MITSLLASFVPGAWIPFARMLGCFQCQRNSIFSSLTEMVMNSPALEKYVPSAANANLSKKDYAELILGVTGVAGLLGSMNLCMQVLNGIPKEYPIDVNNKMEVTLAVLEAARIESPVNNVNVVLHDNMALNINGKEHTFQPGTVVAASIGLSSLDPTQFEKPHKFNPKRENLMKATLNFNHVGYSPIGSGKRQCPGRNIAMKLASDLLIHSRAEKYTPPSENGFVDNPRDQ